ncbi:CBS domain-containing protein [Pontibacter sp. JAM-7]|uniref:CBS domain-containing protein n=1 Tax=Pontibacter sp. JAM-7 TaxID=3366581 RepID=UPI003AF519AF
MNLYHTLKTLSLDTLNCIASPVVNDPFTPDTPAIRIMTDFRQTEPVQVQLDMSLDEAMELLRRMHVRSGLVTDENGTFKGLVTVADLLSRQVLSIATNQGLNRSDLTIRDLMIPKQKLSGISLQTLLQSNVGDLLKTLKQGGSQYLLVIDDAATAICGIISASDIARKLKIPVDISQRATSFREIVEIINSSNGH